MFGPMKYFVAGVSALLSVTHLAAVRVPHRTGNAVGFLESKPEEEHFINLLSIHRGGRFTMESHGVIKTIGVMDEKIQHWSDYRVFIAKNDEGWRIRTNEGLYCWAINLELISLPRIPVEAVSCYTESKTWQLNFLLRKVFNPRVEGIPQIQMEVLLGDARRILSAEADGVFAIEMDMGVDVPDQARFYPLSDMTHNNAKFSDGDGLLVASRKEDKIANAEESSKTKTLEWTDRQEVDHSSFFVIDKPKGKHFRMRAPMNWGGEFISITNGRPKGHNNAGFYLTMGSNVKGVRHKIAEFKLATLNNNKWWQVKVDNYKNNNVVWVGFHALGRPKRIGWAQGRFNDAFSHLELLRVSYDVLDGQLKVLPAIIEAVKGRLEDEGIDSKDQGEAVQNILSILKEGNNDSGNGKEK